MNPLADLIESIASSSVRIDARCTACGNCIVTCPEVALLRAPKRPAVIDDLCTSCGACIEVCPVDAITETSGRGTSRMESQP